VAGFPLSKHRQSAADFPKVGGGDGVSQPVYPNRKPVWRSTYQDVMLMALKYGTQVAMFMTKI